MAKYTPPPISVIQQIRNMKPRSTLVFTDVSTSSVRVTVSVVSKEFGDKRVYRTSKLPVGGQVFRDK